MYLNQSLKSAVAASALAFASALSLNAAALEFDFKDPKGVNNVSFNLDAPLEAIQGSANGISGMVHFDPADPSATKGSITVETASLRVGNNKMQEHMMSNGWLAAEKYPEIVFELSELTDISEEGSKISATANGSMTLKGTTKDVSVPISLTYLEGMLGKRMSSLNGDLLVIRADFSINRSEYGIKPGENLDKVADDIELRLSIAGGAEK